MRQRNATPAVPPSNAQAAPKSVPTPSPRKLFATLVDEREGPCSRILPDRRDQLVMTVLAGPQIGTIVKLTGDSLVIGRAPDADLPLQDESLSWHHARILRLADGCYLEDLHSTNGTFIGSSRIGAPQRLSDGDRIGLGPNVVIKIQLQDALEAEVSQRLYEAMIRDPLTGAHNRLALDERLTAELAFARRHRTFVSVILLDIDHFKAVNDTHGHPAGDQVLRELVTCLSSTIRTEDMLARFGGEEFAIIARGISHEQAFVFAERLRRILAFLPIGHGDQALRITASLGVATASDDVPLYDEHSLLAAADAALYEAKNGGRNRVVVWQPPWLPQPQRSG